MEPAVTSHQCEPCGHHPHPSHCPSRHIAIPSFSDRFTKPYPRAKYAGLVVSHRGRPGSGKSWCNERKRGSPSSPTATRRGMLGISSSPKAACRSSCVSRASAVRSTNVGTTPVRRRSVWACCTICMVRNRLRPMMGKTPGSTGMIISLAAIRAFKLGGNQ